MSKRREKPTPNVHSKTPAGHHLWSQPATISSADAQRLKSALAGVRLTQQQVTENSESAARRVVAYRTGVTVATLASRMD